MVETRSAKKSTKSNKRKKKAQSPSIVSPTVTPSKQENGAMSPAETPVKRTKTERVLDLSPEVTPGKGAKTEMVTPRKEDKTNADNERDETMSKEKEKAIQQVSSVEASWSDRSNVGNLSIREKLFLSIVIFCSICVVWGLCLCFSLCGTTSPTIPAYTEDLTICKTTWSTLAWLTDEIIGNESMAIPQEELQLAQDELTICEESRSSLQQQISILQDAVEQDRELSDRLIASRSRDEIEINNLKKELEQLKRSSKAMNKTVEELTTSCKSKETNLQVEKQLLSKDLVLAIRERDDTQRKLYALEQMHFSERKEIDGKQEEKKQEEKKRRNPLARLLNMNGMMKS